MASSMDLDDQLRAPTDQEMTSMSVDDPDLAKKKVMRASVSYENKSGRFILRKKQFTQQYSHVRKDYCLRLRPCAPHLVFSIEHKSASYC